MDQDLHTFAANVLHTARSKHVTRFGEHKAYICTVAEAMTLAGKWKGSLPAFKAKLLKAHRTGLLVLSRADLVSAMDPELLHWSETLADGATYHFVRFA